jgi:FkbM family methyltransferase
VSPDGIVLYGAGEMGKMALDLLSRIDFLPVYIVDKNYCGSINGVKVIKPESITPRDFEKLTFIICIATIPVNPIFVFLKELGCLDVRHFYDFSEILLKNHISNGWAVPDPKLDQREGIQRVFHALEHDEYSVAHYLQFLWWRLRRKEVLYSDYPVLTGKKYFEAPGFPILNDHERFVDGGTHFGDVLNSFLKKVNYKYDHIWAFEPDASNGKKLDEVLSLIKYDKITFYKDALFNKCSISNYEDGLGYASRIDEKGNLLINTLTLDFLENVNPSIIKLHVEGSELKALHGSVDTIKKNRPIIMVLADHNSDGLYEIANFLKELDNYKLFFYLHDYCGNSAIIYAYPIERISSSKEVKI